MEEQELLERTKTLALRMVNVVAALPKNEAGLAFGRQLLRTGTSVGARARATTRALSTRDQLIRLRALADEADETMYWLELCIAAELVEERRLTPLLLDLDDILVATVAASEALSEQA